MTAMAAAKATAIAKAQAHTQKENKQTNAKNTLITKYKFIT